MSSQLCQNTEDRDERVRTGSARQLYCKPSVELEPHSVLHDASGEGGSVGAREVS